MPPPSLVSAFAEGFEYLKNMSLTQAKRQEMECQVSHPGAAASCAVCMHKCGFHVALCIGLHMGTAVIVHVVALCANSACQNLFLADVLAL